MKLSMMRPIFLFLLLATGIESQVYRENFSVKRHVSKDVYSRLVHNFRYASSAYGPVSLCHHPNGNTLVAAFFDILYDVQGYIARDDNLKEIVVVFRGSLSISNALTDINAVLVHYEPKDDDAPDDVLVHRGFLSAYNSVSDEIAGIISTELSTWKDYSLVVSGHSLGGALASLAAVSLKRRFPNQRLSLFTYGAPRVGNTAWASWITALISKEDMFRSVHTNDGTCTSVPTIVPTSWGYAHHPTEYWQNPDPASPYTTTICDGIERIALSGCSGGAYKTNGFHLPPTEDPSCSASNLSGGINPAHTTYFGIFASTRFCRQTQ